MGFLQDAFAVFKKRNITFIEKHKETDDVYSFIFEKANGLNWKAGQYGLFTITHKKIKDHTKPFTISSAPAENVIRITTRITDSSDFKEAMLELKTGMTIRMAGPLGGFQPSDNTPSLLIAGGIGITPFRSILRQLETEGKKDAKHINLLYLNSDRKFLFKDELDEIAKRTSITITYLDSRDALDKEVNAFVAENKSNSNYFIAGPKSMVDSLYTYLQKQNISKRNIKKDAFFGY